MENINFLKIISFWNHPCSWHFWSSHQVNDANDCTSHKNRKQAWTWLRRSFVTLLMDNLIRDISNFTHFITIKLIVTFSEGIVPWELLLNLCPASWTLYRYQSAPINEKLPVFLAQDRHFWEAVVCSEDKESWWCSEIAFSTSQTTTSGSFATFSYKQ